MDTLWQDLRYAVRTLLRSPGFSAVAVLTLALGIGANTAIFGVVNAVLLRPFPYPQPERIVTLWQHDRAAGLERDGVSAANFLDWKERSRSFAALAAVEPYGLDFMGPEGPVTLETSLVSEGFFAAMGVPALLGRSLNADDYARTPANVYEGGVPSIVLGYRVWRDHFGGERGVVGRTITVDGHPATVVGVMPREFQFPGGPNVWAPVVLGAEARGSRAANYLSAVGRLRPGVTPEAARAEMAAIAAQLAREHPATNRNVGITSVPLAEAVVGSSRPALRVLMGAVGLVLLIASANVASLLLARSVGRRREFAIRAGVGAGHGRLFRQLATEGVVLSLTGGAVGVLLAHWSTRLLVRLAPPGLPRVEEAGVDARVLLFAVAAALLTAVLAGTAPALRLARADLRSFLSGAGRSRVAGRRDRLLRRGLVVGEIALALVLLVGAGLVVRSFLALMQVDRGYRSEGVLAVTVQAWSYFPDPARRALFVREASERLERIPGVQAVGVTSSLPLADAIGADEARFHLVGEPAPRDGELPTAHASVVTSGYFRALEIPLRRGRLFAPGDDAGAPRVVLVNESMARQHWRGEDPVGKRMELRFAGPPVTAEVVGVVGDVRYEGLDRDPGPSLYVPHAQARTGAVTFTVRTYGDPARFARPVRDELSRFNSTMPVAATATLDGVLSESLGQRRFSLILLAGFSLMALLLATIGVYGLVSFATRERVGEIGIRLALGARGADIVRSTVLDGLRLTGAGLGLGVGAALLVTPLLRHLLFGVAPTDALTFSAVAVLLAGVGALASWIPARRAAKLDPMTALRSD